MYIHGDAVEFKKHTFQGHVAAIQGINEVKSMLEASCFSGSAPSAFRIMINDQVYESCNDASNLGAGDKLLNLLKRWDICNALIVVSCTKDDLAPPIGVQFYKHLLQAAKTVLELTYRLQKEQQEAEEEAKRNAFKYDLPLEPTPNKRVKRSFFQIPKTVMSAETMEFPSLDTLPKIISSNFQTEDKLTTIQKNPRQQIRNQFKAKMPTIGQISAMKKMRVPSELVMVTIKCVAKLLGVRYAEQWNNAKEILRRPDLINSMKSLAVEKLHPKLVVYVRKQLMREDFTLSRVRIASVGAAVLLTWIIEVVQRYEYLATGRIPEFPGCPSISDPGHIMRPVSAGHDSRDAMIEYSRTSPTRADVLVTGTLKETESNTSLLTGQVFTPKQMLPKKLQPTSNNKRVQRVSSAHEKSSSTISKNNINNNNKSSISLASDNNNNIANFNRNQSNTTVGTKTTSNTMLSRSSSKNSHNHVMSGSNLQPASSSNNIQQEETSFPPPVRSLTLESADAPEGVEIEKSNLYQHHHHQQQHQDDSNNQNHPIKSSITSNNSHTSQPGPLNSSRYSAITHVSGLESHMFMGSSWTTAGRSMTREEWDKSGTSGEFGSKLLK